MSLLGEVVAYLAERQQSCALIGGEALAVHGVARSTLDADLLVAATAVLRKSFWSDLSTAEVEVRRGDMDDPLRGVVRIARRREVVDVIVGPVWTRRLLAETLDLVVAGAQVPVINPAGLVILKLFAAGPQDLLDVRLLLAHGGTELRAEVESRLRHVPAAIRRTWRNLAKG